VYTQGIFSSRNSGNVTEENISQAYRLEPLYSCFEKALNDTKEKPSLKSTN
jgi:hypothetical protein